MTHHTITTAREAVDYIAGAAPRHQRIMLVASPGPSATMLARRLVYPLGALTDDEARDVAWIRYGARLFHEAEDCWGRARPFRAPHYTCSEPAIFGGGNPARPGELHLAHAGVLYLDDMHEFRGHVLNRLLYGAPPSLDGVRVPSQPRMIVGSVLPCPCGYRNSGRRACVCTEARLERWDRMLAAYAGHFDEVITLRLEPADMQRSMPPIDWWERSFADTGSKLRA